MQFMKRIFMLVLANILIMVALDIVYTIVISLFPGLQVIANGPLIVLSLVWGFGGAFLSLALSKQFAKWFQGVRVIDPDRAGPEERWLISTVHSLAREAGITTMPEVGIWDSPEVNAFCTGPTKNSALVAVSTGILQRMDRDELQGVLGHELSHAANGDMVTMTLIQGVVNSFVIFASFILARLLVRGDDRRRGDSFLEMVVRWVLEITLSLLANLVIVYPYSRWREYRADAGGARLAGKARMIAALRALQDTFRVPVPQGAGGHPALASFKISGRPRSALWSTHPSLEDRIAALERL